MPALVAARRGADQGQTYLDRDGKNQELGQQRSRLVGRGLGRTEGLAVTPRMSGGA
jgi:hypothetical protein